MFWHIARRVYQPETRHTSEIFWGPGPWPIINLATKTSNYRWGPGRRGTRTMANKLINDSVLNNNRDRLPPFPTNSDGPNRLVPRSGGKAGRCLGYLPKNVVRPRANFFSLTTHTHSHIHTHTHDRHNTAHTKSFYQQPKIFVVIVIVVVVVVVRSKQFI